MSAWGRPKGDDQRALHDGFPVTEPARADVPMPPPGSGPRPESPRRRSPPVQASLPAGSGAAVLGAPRPGLSFRDPVMPWSAAAPDERRFRRILHQVLAAATGFALALPWWPVLPPLRSVPEAPAPTARLLLPPPKAPVVPPAAPAPRPSGTAAPRQPAPPVAAAAAPPRAVAPAPSVAQARQPREQRPPGEDLAEARRRASGVGLLAARDQLAQLQAAPVAVQLQAPARTGPGIGQGSGPGVGAGTEPGVPTRAWITAQATQGSGGVQSAALSQGSGGGGLPGRATTLVEGAIGGGGGGGPGGGAGGGTGPGAGGTIGSGGSGTGAGTGGTLRRQAGGKASRSIEDVRLVFERHKGAIYAMYQRALRDDAGLQGKVVLELRIAPGGEVSAVRVLSSELRAPDLEARLLARVRQFDFGAREVEPMVVTWPVDFLPS